MDSNDNPPHIIIDDNDDDEFDWDAAVRQIDVVCQNSKTSTSHPYTTPTFVPSETTILNGPNVNVHLPLRNIDVGASRQTTLDKFVGRAILGTEPPARDFRVYDSAFVDGNDGPSLVSIDADTAKTWIYPVNIPFRDYQFAITKTALFSNTLVALPTGLGKTLIASVVIYNYFRWFPEGKIVFTAPSRPLVMQQIEACHNIVGIPQEWTIDMTGKISPVKRAFFWKSKRVFFVTPQVLEKDIQSGTCLVKHLVCLVIDEAHRAVGNYSYSVVVRELLAVTVQLRILALTATPGSKQQTIQHVIDNLLISTLEYRNESDPDVSPYVHSRKIELIEVAMGKDANEISDLLLNVIRTYAVRLNGMGILLNRDYKTLSPSDLLNSRDKFRQAPPPKLPQTKYGEVEWFFAALITLYHIRKLLSSHGIKPAHEMLQEKLQQGSFANLMARNEDITRAKFLMQRTLSQGAPDPKLSKMLEVLMDHFKKNDARNSRVIIFSNFRGSVRDIMDALSNHGDIIKAAQFIGQSAGKTVKGQSQKVQQAVLEKFRAGGYNVIVATSIGEEGLDIMEVDLVVCFDANISPLRMVQRMGRTGRKHDGRVVVLACQGSELSGYMRKQASSKTIRKLMRNGGTASFNFHSSPRMVPHAFRPDVQFVELAIEKFVPRGKRTKYDQAVETSIVTDSLTVGETDLIFKYFNKSENKWRPSLIAFPHFQTFPSGVHKVMHSHQTGMLIDTMQCLQGLQFDRDEDDSFIKDEVAPLEQVDVQSNEKNDHDRTDVLITNSDSQRHILKNVSRTEGLPPSVGTAETYSQSSPTDQKPTPHLYLFGSDFVSVDAHGNVLILSIPSLPFTSFSAKERGSGKQFPNFLKQQCSGASLGKSGELEEEASGLQSSSQERGMRGESLSTFRLCNSDAKQQESVALVEHPGTNSLDDVSLKGSIHSGGVPEVLDANGLTIQGDGLYNCLMDTELSPRLTNYIASGVVPESPVNGQSSEKRCGRQKQEVLIAERVEWEGNIAGVSDVRCAFSSPIHSSPLEDTKSNSSRNWYLSPTCILGSIKRGQKLKRLRRYGDCAANTKDKDMKGNPPVGWLKDARSSSDNNLTLNGSNHGQRKTATNARTYVEEEAEVSSGTDISEDEEDSDVSSSCDGSFIDDRVYPTAASSLDGAGTVDMMAIYRRSLLSQSPISWKPNCASSPTVDSLSSARRISESESFTAGTSDSLHVPQAETTYQSAKTNSRSLLKEMEGISKAIPSTSLVLTRDANKEESKSRKMLKGASVPNVNLEREFPLQSNVADEEISHKDLVEEHCNIDEEHCNIDVSSDDQFYDGLDLEEVEAQATFLLKNNAQLDKQVHEVTPKLDSYSVDYLSSPSFDLGI